MQVPITLNEVILGCEYRISTEPTDEEPSADDGNVQMPIGIQSKSVPKDIQDSLFLSFGALDVEKVAEITLEPLKLKTVRIPSYKSINLINSTTTSCLHLIPCRSHYDLFLGKRVQSAFVVSITHSTRLYIRSALSVNMASVSTTTRNTVSTAYTHQTARLICTLPPPCLFLM